MQENKDERVPPATPEPPIPEVPIPPPEMPIPPPETPPPTQPFDGGLAEEKLERKLPSAYEGGGTMGGGSPDD